MLLAILLVEFGEIFGVFVEHDLLFGVDAVLERVETGCGLGLSGVRSGVCCAVAIRILD